MEWGGAEEGGVRVGLLGWVAWGLKRERGHAKRCGWGWRDNGYLKSTNYYTCMLRTTVRRI